MRYQKDYGTFPEPCVKDQDGTYIAMVLNNGGDVGQLSKEEGEKALSLLVAAPELLDMLKEAVDRCEMNNGEGEEDEFIEMFNNAIAKAEGRR